MLMCLCIQGSGVQFPKKQVKKVMFFSMFFGCCKGEKSNEKEAFTDIISSSMSCYDSLSGYCNTRKRC